MIYKGFKIVKLDGYINTQYSVYDSMGFNMNSHLSFSDNLNLIKQEIDDGVLDEFKRPVKANQGGRK